MTLVGLLSVSSPSSPANLAHTSLLHQVCCCTNAIKFKVTQSELTFTIHSKKCVLTSLSAQASANVSWAVLKCMAHVKSPCGLPPAMELLLPGQVPRLLYRVEVSKTDKPISWEKGLPKRCCCELLCHFPFITRLHKKWGSLRFTLALSFLRTRWLCFYQLDKCCHVVHVITDRDKIMYFPADMLIYSVYTVDTMPCNQG